MSVVFPLLGIKITGSEPQSCYETAIIIWVASLIARNDDKKMAGRYPAILHFKRFDV
jgi:hypothetical protein